MVMLSPRTRQRNIARKFNIISKSIKIKKAQHDLFSTNFKDYISSKSIPTILKES